MTSAVVPTACHQTEMLFKCLSKCTPKVLMRPDVIFKNVHTQWRNSCTHLA
jgi:hypothetical protein